MALPSSGQITMAMVNTELGYSANRTISLNDPLVRALAGRSGTSSIALSHLRGKRLEFYNGTMVGGYNVSQNTYGASTYAHNCASFGGANRAWSLSPSAQTAGPGAGYWIEAYDIGQNASYNCNNNTYGGPYWPGVDMYFGPNFELGVSRSSYVSAVVINGVTRNIVSYGSNPRGFPRWLTSANGISGTHFGTGTKSLRILR